MNQLDVYPNLKACATSDLQPGDIFFFLGSDTNFYGLKTEDSGPKSEFVFLGPDFSGFVKEPSILPWTSEIVLSMEKSYRLDLPVELAAWSTSPQRQPAVVLALVEGRFFVRANGRAGSGFFFPCFIEFGTGKIIEGTLGTGKAAYTPSWGISLPGPHQASTRILSFGGRTD